MTMRKRQRLLRALVTDIIADVDEAAREVVLTIHWQGGQHSTCGFASRIRRARLPHPRSGPRGHAEHGEPWSDEDIAATLNRMGMPTGEGNLDCAPCQLVRR